MHASPARTSTLHLPALSARNRSPKGGDRELDAASRKEVSKKGQLVSDAPRGLRAREPSATLAHTKASRKRRGKNAFLEEVWLTFRDCGAGVRVTWPSICGQYSRGSVVAEVNSGGAMVEQVVQAAASEARMRIRFREVRAARGKVVRAEPVAALYDTGRVHHVGSYQELEDELIAFTTAGYSGCFSMGTD